MTPKHILHIGLHKTASTFLQKSVFPEIPNRLLLTRPYTQHNHAWNSLQYADDTLFDEQLFIEEISKYASQPLLISDESLSGKPVNFGYLNRTIIAKRLAKFFPESEVVIFIRGQKELIKSHYNQWVKESPQATRKFSQFIWYSSTDYFQIQCGTSHPSLSTLKFNSNDSYLNLESLKLSGLVRLYKSLFPTVHVFLFEDIINNSDDLNDRLLEIFETKNINLRPSNPSKKNESIPTSDLQHYILRNRTKHIINLPLLKKIGGILTNKERVPMDINNDTLSALCSSIYAHDNTLLHDENPEIGIKKYAEEYFLNANNIE